MPARFSHVSDQIYRGGEPSYNDLQMLRDIYGVKHVISLDGPIGSNISNYVKELGMEHTVIPISGRWSISLIDFLKSNISDLLDTQPVYIHCRHGSDRTGMAIAFHRIKNQGWSPDSALEEAKAFGFGDKLSADTNKLYTDAILSNGDSNDSIDDDVVSAMRDQFDMGNNPPAYSPRQSFSVPDDYKYTSPDEFITNPPLAFKDPYAFVNSNISDIGYNRKKELRKALLEILLSEDNLKGLPQVGGRDAGSIPYGVGPTETGGFLNL